MGISDVSHNTGRPSTDLTEVAEAMGAELAFHENSLPYRMRWIERFCSGRQLEEMRSVGPTEYMSYQLR